MRLDRLKVRAFKNLDNVEIDFDESELSTVLIGENGTGKSNVIEAIVTIFRDLDLGDTTAFPYSVAYNCHGRRVTIDNGYAGKGLSFTIDGQAVTKSGFKACREELLPANVFGYYSGASRRLEVLFDRHQTRYYKKVIAPDSSPDDIRDIGLRRLFYCRPAYGQLALLSYFAFGTDSAKSFLKKHMGISGFDSALIVLRKPRWAGTKPTRHQLDYGDPRFWYSAGLVRGFLEKLWEHSLAPIANSSREQDDYRTKPSSEEQAYIFIRDEASLRNVARSFGDEKTFFALLETLDISDLIREVRIWVDKAGVEGEIPFHEISDGEKQLLSVLGLMRFTGRDESLFLLDEPDTHHNPAWKWDYLTLVKEVAQKTSESHIIMTSHDPLTMGSLKRSQVQVMSMDDGGRVTVSPPDVDPRGLGFTSILTQIFGLPTTLDPETQHRLDERNTLMRIDQRTQAQDRRLIELSEELRQLGFLIEDREPEYAEFLRALGEIKRERRTSFTPGEIAQRNEVAKRMLAEIMARERAASMIYVYQDAARIPQAWIDKVAALRAQLEALGTAEERKAFIDKSAGVWAEIKKELLEMSHWKCWYSEAPDTVSDWHVDHFRPKGRALDEDRTPHEGYAWLAFDWKNYRIAGSYPNSPHRDEENVTRGKWDFFPLANGSVRATWDNRDCDHEICLLLDPAKKNDPKLMTFDEEGAPIPSDPTNPITKKKVEITVHYLYLDSPRLIAARKRKWRDTSDWIVEYRNVCPTTYEECTAQDFERLERLLDRLAQITGPDAPYAATARACLRANDLSELIQAPEETLAA